jgi:hypothetical protein
VIEFFNYFCIVLRNETAKLFWMSWFVNNFVNDGDDDEITVFLKLMVVESLKL